MFSCKNLMLCSVPAAPLNPSGLKLSGYGMVSSVYLSWNPPLVGSVSEYRLQFSLNSGLSWSDLSFRNIVDPSAGGSVVVEGLDPSLTYCFRVSGGGAWSGSLCLKPKVGPAAPPNIRAFRYRGWRDIGSFAPERIFVDWDAPSTDMAILSYVLEMKEGNNDWGANPTNFGTVVYAPAAVVSVTLAEDLLVRYAVSDSQRLFRVKADTGGGYGPWSSQVSVGDGMGMSPSAVDWSIGGGDIDIYWSAPSQTNGYILSGYVVSIVSSGGVVSWSSFGQGTTASVRASQFGSLSSALIRLRARYSGGPDVAAVQSLRDNISF